MTRWIRNLNFSTKLVVIMVAALVPVIFLTALYLTEKQSDIGHAERELAGRPALLRTSRRCCCRSVCTRSESIATLRVRVHPISCRHRSTSWRAS